MEIDIRGDQTVEAIIVADRVGTEEARNSVLASKLTQSGDDKFVKLSDSACYVIIENKEHAENLIKGLHKAIELGWLK